jgi:transposase-like protein
MRVALLHGWPLHFPSDARTSVRLMDRDWLAARLEAAESIEAIAREVGKHPGTVAYWVNRHGLKSGYAARHAARGPLAREQLEQLIESGLSIRQIAREVDRSATTVRHWLRHYGLRTQPSRYALRDGTAGAELMRECRIHGWTWFRRIGTATRYRCAECAVETVSNRRRRVKQILVEEAGGSCVACGYDAFTPVLQFHHVDRATKRFHLGREGVTRSLERARAEAAKCVLLCANCHVEVELGFRELPVTSDATGSGSILGSTVDGPG